MEEKAKGKDGGKEVGRGEKKAMAGRRRGRRKRRLRERRRRREKEGKVEEDKMGKTTSKAIVQWRENTLNNREILIF